MDLKQEVREVYYDKMLNVEAYKFEDINQNLPNRWHDYYLDHYVIGYVVKEKQELLKKNTLIFNPRDNHSCNDTKYNVLHCGCILMTCFLI